MHSLWRVRCHSFFNFYFYSWNLLQLALCKGWKQELAEAAARIQCYEQGGRPSQGTQAATVSNLWPLSEVSASTSGVATSAHLEKQFNASAEGRFSTETKIFQLKQIGQLAKLAVQLQVQGLQPEEESEPFQPSVPTPAHASEAFFQAHSFTQFCPSIFLKHNYPMLF